MGDIVSLRFAAVAGFAERLLINKHVRNANENTYSVKISLNYKKAFESGSLWVILNTF